MASNFDTQQMAEVLSFLPPYEGKVVLEFGAGLGSFTTELAKKATKVIAIDSTQSELKKNGSTNRNHGNIEFMYGVVTSADLNIPAESIDLIFINFLLMNLTDKEVEEIAARLLKWVKIGGHIFFRESCSLESRDHEQTTNPTHYHGPGFYTKVFKECHISNATGKSFEYSLVASKCLGAQESNEINQNQICLIWQKVNSEEDRGFQKKLDNVLFKLRGIVRFERVFGHGFVSPGGIDTAKECVAMLDLKSGQKVIDVGCGPGGSVFHMAENFDVDVVGIDYSENMILIASERAIGCKRLVEFEVADCTTISYPDNTFDVIYSRDVILYTLDKPALFRNFYKWLKPGGKILITDYCRGSGTISEEYMEFIKQRGYNLDEIPTYAEMLRDAGFSDVTAEDRTKRFTEVTTRELERVEKEKEEIISDLSEEDYNYLVNLCKTMLARAGRGEHRWGLFRAQKK